MNNAQKFISSEIGNLLNDPEVDQEYKPTLVIRASGKQTKNISITWETLLKLEQLLIHESK